MLLVVVGMLFGCGEEDLAMRHYNPSSPLPLRVDTSATPQPTEESMGELQPITQDQQASSEISTDETDGDSTLVSDAEAGTSNEKALKQSIHLPTPTPEPISTPVPTQTPSPTPKPQKKKSTPTPVPDIKPLTVKPEKSPPPEKISEADDMKNPEADDMESSETDVQEVASPPVEKKAEKKQKDEKDLSEEEEVPIVTPDGISIDKLLVCSKVVDRNPVDCGSEFSLTNTGRIFTWMRVSGVTPPKTIKHAYYWEDKFIASVNLKLKYTSMRTWSQKTFKPDHSGQWKVVLMAENDQVIAVREWTIAP